MELKLGPGLWRQRNGVIVEITVQITLQAATPKGRVSHKVWLGHCLCHGEKRNWNTDGSYAAVGQHDFDIVGRAKKGATDGHRKTAGTQARLSAD